MKTLAEHIKEAEDKNIAIGHFNISNLEGFHAIVSASRELGLPVIIGVSEGEEDAVGLKEIVALVKTAKDEGLPIFLNADHHYSFERVKKCIDAGFDSVIYDGAEKSLEENIATTKMCVEYARSIGKDILVEAEIGYIGSGSSIKDTIPEGTETKTTPEEAKRFVEETGVDLLAPSVGNIHGLIKTGNPHIDTDLVKQIREASGVPLVLHGGSGLSDDDFRNGIKAGIAMVHINTELRVAYTEALRKVLAENKEETTPYKYSNVAKEAMKKVVIERLKLFNNL